MSWDSEPFQVNGGGHHCEGVGVEIPMCLSKAETPFHEVRKLAFLVH